MKETQTRRETQALWQERANGPACDDCSDSLHVTGCATEVHGSWKNSKANVGPVPQTTSPSLPPLPLPPLPLPLTIPSSLPLSPSLKNPDTTKEQSGTLKQNPLLLFLTAQLGSEQFGDWHDTYVVACHDVAVNQDDYAHNLLTLNICSKTALCVCDVMWVYWKNKPGHKRIAEALVKTHAVCADARFWHDISLCYAAPNILAAQTLYPWTDIRVVHLLCPGLSKTVTSIADKYKNVYRVRDACYDTFGIVLNLGRAYQMYKEYSRSTSQYCEI